MNRVFDMEEFPQGEMPQEDHFILKEEPVPEPGEGEVVVKTLFLRMDPGSRSKMVPPEESPYEDTWVGDEPVSSGGIGEVIGSKHPEFSEGNIVEGRFRWADYDLFSGDELDPVSVDNAPIQAKLHALGHTGRTAYFGMTEIGRPEEGETVVVSSAAGSVGSVAAQIAKIHGCRVVGIAGSDEKVRHITDELGLDAGINYKDTQDMEAALADSCPEGIDIYYDNVGGEIADAAMRNLNKFGRVVQCGRTSLINSEGGAVPTGPRHEGIYIKKRARREGFVVYDYADRFDEANEQLKAWYDENKLRYKETVTEGLENAPQAFFGLFESKNIGKQLVASQSGLEFASGSLN